MNQKCRLRVYSHKGSQEPDQTRPVCQIRIVFCTKSMTPASARSGANDYHSSDPISRLSSFLLSCRLRRALHVPGGSDSVSCSEPFLAIPRSLKLSPSFPRPQQRSPHLPMDGTRQLVGSSSKVWYALSTSVSRCLDCKHTADSSSITQPATTHACRLIFLPWKISPASLLSASRMPNS